MLRNSRPGVGAWAFSGLVLGLSVGGCTAPDRAPLPLPPAPLDVVMEEYRFVHAPIVPAGRVVVRMRNAGQLRHELTLVRVPDTFAPIDEQLRSETRQAVEPVADVTREPGSTGSFAADLAPGRYAFICFLTDPDGVKHFLKGMSSEFRVEG